jgi:alpha-1,2-mannosyltransferase
LILSWRMVRLYGDKLAPFLVAALASAYLMIFNPRTETVSFIVLSPYIALLAAIIFRQKAPMALGWLLVFLCVGLGSDCYGDIYKLTRIWFKPMLSCIFMLVLAALAFKKAGFLDWEKKAADPQ